MEKETNKLIIKHLNHLRLRLSKEKDAISKMKETPTNELHQAEIDLNIEYYNLELKEIDDIVKKLENEQS